LNPAARLRADDPSIRFEAPAARRDQRRLSSWIAPDSIIPSSGRSMTAASPGDAGRKSQYRQRHTGLAVKVKELETTDA